MSPCGFGKWRDLEGARVLEDSVGDRSDGDVSDDPRPGCKNRTSAQHAWHLGTGYRSVVSCTMSRVTGTGRALRAAANARRRSRARAKTFRTLASVCSALDRGRPWAVEAISHSALTMAQRASQSSALKKSRLQEAGTIRIRCVLGRSAQEKPAAEEE